MPVALPPVARSRALRAGATVLALALLATGCGGDDEPGTPTASGGSGSASPSVDVEVPDGVELTEAGTELDLGEPATVAYEVGQDRGSVLRLTVDSLRTGRVRDLNAFQLDDATRASTPYYVRVTVENVGTEDLGGAAVPLFAVDGRDTLVQPSSFTTSFERCPSTGLPDEFGPDAEVTTCLVYLLPEKGTLEAMSYRPQQSLEPITWTGEVRPPG